MSELDDFLKSLTRSVDNSIPAEEEPVVEEPTVDEKIEQEQSELDDFIKRINERNQKTVIGDVSGDTQTNIEPVGGDLGLDVTEKATAGAQAANPTRDYDYFYGEEPSLGLNTRINAIIGDIFNPEDMPNADQQKRDQYNADMAAFEQRAQEIYDSANDYTLPEAKLLGIDLTGFADDEFFSDGKVKVYQYLDNDGEVQYTLLPPPDSGAFERIVSQAGRNIFQETYGLVERDADGSLDLNILEDSEYATKVPDYDQGLGEGLATDLLTFGVPGGAAFKLGKGAVKAGTDVVKKADDLIGTSKFANKARIIGNAADNAAQYLGGSLAVAMTEAVLSQEGDEGMIIGDEWVKKNFTGLSDERAKDVAMIMDGFVVNGLFDTVLFLGGKGYRFLRDKGADAAGFVSPELVKNKAQRQGVFAVLTEIDPKLAEMDEQELVANLRNLAITLNKNSTIVARVGESVREIDADTTNALLKGGENYIRVSRQKEIAKMSAEEADKFIKDETEQLVNRVIGVARGNLDNAGLRQQQANMLDEVGNTFLDEANRVNPEGVNFNQETVPDLVDQRNANVADAQAEADAATAQAEQFRTDAGQAVANDPFIKELLEGTDPVRFFNDTKYVDELRRLYGEDFVNTYRKAYDDVNAAYAAIPNDPVDLPAFKTQLADVFNNAGGLGETTQDSAPIITALKRVFGDKLASGTDDLTLADPRETTPSLQTPQQIIDGLTGDIGYQDLVQLKRELDTLIGSANNRNVSTALQNLRKHITSVEEGGQAAFVARNGGEAAELVKAADDLYIDTQSRFQNAITTRNLSDAANTPAYAGSSTRVPDGGSRRGQPDLESTAVNEITPNMLGDRTGQQVEQLRFALSSDFARGEVNKPFVDLFVAQQTDRLAKALRDNDQQTIAEIDKAFEGIITELKNLEAMDLVNELDNAKMRILGVQGELGDRALEADKVAEMALARKVEAENSIVSSLMSKNVKGAAQSTPSQTIRRELMGADAGNYITELMAEIDKLPADKQGPARQATQSMLLRAVRDMTKTATDVGVGNKKDIALGKLATLTNPEANGMIEAVSKAFPNDEFMRATMMMTLGSMGDVSLASRMKVARAGSDTAANMGIRDSVSTGILFAFGYMNPTAAAARRLTSSQIDAMERLGKQEQDRIIETILADPNKFADLVEMIANQAEPSRLSVAKDMFLNSAYNTIRYEVRVDEEGDEDEQTNSMLYDAATGVIDKALNLFP